MENITVYGIKNCDTMKKALQWLDSYKVAYTFHDYKKSGANAAVLTHAIKQLGWEAVLNRKGTTWHKLPDHVKDGMDADKALTLALENPSVIRRPLIMWGRDFLLSFDEAVYAKNFINQ